MTTTAQSASVPVFPNQMVAAQATSDELARVRWACAAGPNPNGRSNHVEVVLVTQTLADVAAWGDANNIRWADPSDAPIE